MNGYIYKIINDINGKMYIGLCTTSIEQRFKTHCKDRNKESNKNRPLYRAMNKYGIENFHVELIEECDIDFLGEREQYWIQHYQTYHNGYNATLGGEGKPLYDHQLILEKLSECPYPVKVAKEIGCSTDIISDIAKANNIQTKNLGNEFLKKKVVYAVDKKTNEIIEEFESTVKAAEWCFEKKLTSKLTSGVRSHISECANNKRKSAYGYKWVYKE